jgi:PAS domain S-box-containing protein
MKTRKQTALDVRERHRKVEPMVEHSVDQKSESELQARLAAIVESSEDAIVSKDLEGTIQSWNRGAERIFGYTAEEVIGKHISILVVPERVDEIPKILERIRRGERVEHYETKRRAKNGSVLTVSLTVSPVRDASGAIIGASKIARDITERERHRQALEAANARLTESNLDLQQFAYTASHDLREPLRMVSMYGAMLERKFGGQLGDTGDEYIRYIVDGAERMQKLIDDLLAFTRISVLDQIKPEEIHANLGLDTALKNLEAAIRESAACITWTDLPSVRVHPFQLEQLFQNLIANAIQYRSEEPPRIHVTAERSGDRQLFSVQDNGIGIDAQYQEQIFGMFKRLHASADYPGTGMGLAICERIIQRTGGRIWVESQRGRGSTFFFTLPV